jgi:hypothetical protein
VGWPTAECRGASTEHDGGALPLSICAAGSHARTASPLSATHL